MPDIAVERRPLKPNMATRLAAFPHVRRENEDETEGIGSPIPSSIESNIIGTPSKKINR
jgi:hypothetical protein